jgi:hypothetical protein
MTEEQRDIGIGILTRKRRVFMILMIVFASVASVYFLLFLVTLAAWVPMFPVFLVVSFIFFVPAIVFLALFLYVHGELSSDKAIASASRRNSLVSPKNVFALTPTFQKTFQTSAYSTTLGIDESKGLVQFICPAAENHQVRKKLTPVIAIKKIKDFSVYSDGVANGSGKVKASGKAMANQSANLVEIFIDDISTPYLCFDFGGNRGECFRFFETLKAAFPRPPHISEKKE